MTTTVSNPNVETAINTIFEVLGEPLDSWQHEALEQYNNGDAKAVKKIYASHLRDYYSKCLGFLVSATNTNPNLFKILAAAANAAADHAQVKTLDKISDGNAIAFESTNLVEEAIENILKFLTPQTDYHQLALLERNNYAALKELESKNPDDHLIKALLYLTKATPDSPVLFTILAEAATVAAMHVRSIEHQKITAAIQG